MEEPRVADSTSGVQIVRSARTKVRHRKEKKKWPPKMSSYLPRMHKQNDKPGFYRPSEKKITEFDARQECTAFFQFQAGTFVNLAFLSLSRVVPSARHSGNGIIERDSFKKKRRIEKNYKREQSLSCRRETLVFSVSHGHTPPALAFTYTTSRFQFPI